MRFVYRLQDPVTVVLDQTKGRRLRQLPAGSLFYATAIKPDRNGLIEGVCNGTPVQMFSRDLEHCARSIGSVYGEVDPDISLGVA